MKNHVRNHKLKILLANLEKLWCYICDENNRWSVKKYVIEVKKNKLFCSSFTSPSRSFTRDIQRLSFARCCWRRSHTHIESLWINNCCHSLIFFLQRKTKKSNDKKADQIWFLREMKIWEKKTTPRHTKHLINCITFKI